MTKILVIEDSKDLRDDVVEMLSLEGYAALGADNGLVGVDMARQEAPDLIICDIMMPEMDGYGVLEELRRDHYTANIPFIFLTAKTDRIDMRQGMVLGADDYLTKPFMVNELLDSIQSQLRKRADLNRLVEKRMEELRENILTALPHELRTPLNTVIGFSDMLISECQHIKPDQIADWAGHINIAAHRLHRLVENYLYYTRIEVMSHSKPDDILNASTEHPRAIIEIQAMKLAQQYERESDLVMDVDDVESIRITEQDASKIVRELVDNAFKFSDSKSTVKLSTTIADTSYTICVEDNGRGMSDERLNQIGAYMQFERDFYEQQGMGLGLVIVKRLVELYKGTLEFESKADEFTRICVQLPR